MWPAGGETGPDSCVVKVQRCWRNPVPLVQRRGGSSGRRCRSGTRPSRSSGRVGARTGRSGRRPLRPCPGPLAPAPPRPPGAGGSVCSAAQSRKLDRSPRSITIRASVTAGCAWRLERGCRVDLPRRRVIASLPSDHTRAIESLHGEPPFLLDPLYAQQQRPDRYCAARNAGSDPPKTCGFAAQWALLRHTHGAGSLPVKSSLREGIRRRCHDRMRRRSRRGRPVWSAERERSERRTRTRPHTLRLAGNNTVRGHGRTAADHGVAHSDAINVTGAAGPPAHVLRPGRLPSRTSGRVGARTGQSGRRPLRPCPGPRAPARPQQLRAGDWSSRPPSPGTRIGCTPPGGCDSGAGPARRKTPAGSARCGPRMSASFCPWFLVSLFTESSFLLLVVFYLFFNYLSGAVFMRSKRFGCAVFMRNTSV